MNVISEITSNNHILYAQNTYKSTMSNDKIKQYIFVITVIDIYYLNAAQILYRVYMIFLNNLFGFKMMIAIR